MTRPALDPGFDWGTSPRTAEQRLYVAVLVRTARDALGEEISDCPGALAEAREWLLLPENPERRFVCEAAGLPEPALLRWARGTFPEWTPPPVPDAEHAAALIRELRRNPPNDLVRWASERGISPRWALAQQPHLVSNAELAALLRARLERGAVAIADIARETGAAEARVYMAIHALRAEGADLQPTRTRCYARSPGHYFARALRAGAVNVYALAEITGHPHRRFRRLVDARRAAGVPLVNVSPGVFAVIAEPADAPSLQVVEHRSELNTSLEGAVTAPREAKGG